ncbi:MAG: hypothetical protein QOI40_5114, partial [Alphaproteobacteria bacterium]|nr:hypothetical protein [Alphaproteobacteria bacterium]
TRAILIGGIALLVAGSAGAGAQTFPLECDQRDAQIVNQTEQHGDTRDMPGDIRYDGLSTMKHSRNACYLGRVVVGHADDSLFLEALANLAQT